MEGAGTGLLFGVISFITPFSFLFSLIFFFGFSHFGKSWGRFILNFALFGCTVVLSYFSYLSVISPASNLPFWAMPVIPISCSVLVLWYFRIHHRLSNDRLMQSINELIYILSPILLGFLFSGLTLDSLSPIIVSIIFESMMTESNIYVRLTPYIIGLLFPMFIVSMLGVIIMRNQSERKWDKVSGIIAGSLLALTLLNRILNAASETALMAK